MGMETETKTHGNRHSEAGQNAPGTEAENPQNTDAQRAEAAPSATKTGSEPNGPSPEGQKGSSEAENEDHQSNPDINSEHYAADSDLPVPADEGPVDEEMSLIRELEEQLQEARDKHLRLLAEFDNFKRRNAKERIELRKTAAEDLIVELLGVMDDFQRAKSALDANPGAVTKETEGFLLIAGKLRHVLDQRDLKAMKAKGMDFDPEQHEAITEVPAPDPSLKGKVVDVIEEGYLLGEKIIRYAKVVVGK